MSKPMLIGKKKSAGSSGGVQCHIKAAKKIQATSLPAKSVFCVDNLDCSVDIDDITSFVSSLGVSIVSCFDAKTRRSAQQKRSNFVPDDRKAFRLCIVKNDEPLLLNADLWPSDVTVSRWFFKPKLETDGAAGQSMESSEPVNVINLLTSLPSYDSATSKPKQLISISTEFRDVTQQSLTIIEDLNSADNVGKENDVFSNIDDAEMTILCDSETDLNHGDYR
jgi:hypothetical protein